MMCLRRRCIIVGTVYIILYLYYFSIVQKSFKSIIYIGRRGAIVKIESLPISLIY